MQHCYMINMGQKSDSIYSLAALLRAAVYTLLSSAMTTI